jgi:PAS domain S-box-containing protein
VGLSYLDFAERPSEAATTLRLAAEGMLDAFQARRRFRRPDKSKVEVRSCGWAIRWRAGPDLGLWVVGDGVTAPDDEAPPPPAEPPEPSMTSGPEGRHLAIAALDPSWRVTQVSPVANEMLVWRSSEFIGTSITELAHPEDRVALLVAFARATTGVTATARLRLRQHDGRWRTVRVTMSVAEGTGVPVFGFVLSQIDHSAPEGARSELLEHHLRRIGAEVQAAGLLASHETIDLVDIPATRDLTSRQMEVLLHLLRGERVPAIARQMYLSQSTVRNHLSTIFRKLGVHSQQELINLLRQPGSSGSPTES